MMEEADRLAIGVFYEGFMGSDASIFVNGVSCSIGAIKSHLLATPHIAPCQTKQA